MKKLLALSLALIMILSLAACGKKNEPSAPSASEPSVADAKELLTNVWAKYSEEEKFPAAGGDFSEENNVMDGPGKYTTEDAAALDATFGLPEANAAMVDDAASLMHMMNANTFTGAAFHVAKSEDVSKVTGAMKDNILARQWVCGFPDQMVIYTVGSYVISAFGAEDIISEFRNAVEAAYPAATLVCQEAITLG